MRAKIGALLAIIMTLHILLPVTWAAHAETDTTEEYIVPESPAVTYNMNVDWKYKRAVDGKTMYLSAAKEGVAKEGKDFFEVDYDDSDWETVSVPHPINAKDSFDSGCLDSGETGVYRGFMFYRKHITVPETDAGKKLFLEFESVRQSIYLWVNGELVGYYEAGIIASGYDVTDFIKCGEDNVIAVATDNSSSRGNDNSTRETKPGSEAGAADGSGFQWNTNDFNEVQGGITGNVNLIAKGGVYQTLPLYNNLKTKGNYIYATDFDLQEGTATITVEGEIRNESDSDETVTLEVNIVENIDPNKDSDEGEHDKKPYVAASFSSGEVNVPIAADKENEVYKSVIPEDAYNYTAAERNDADLTTVDVTNITASDEVTGLKFWSPDSPNLYDVYTVLKKSDGTVLDVQKTTTGFRKVDYDINDGGLKINGQPVWLTGYAQRATNEWAVIGVANDWLQDMDMQWIKESNSNFIRWMHVAPKPVQIRAGDKYGVVSAAPAGDKEGDATGRQWDQRVEAMRDVIIYYRNSPSIIFWEAGNNEITPAHQQKMTDIKNELDPHGERFAGCRTISSVEQIEAAEYAGTMCNRHASGAKASMAKLNKYMPIMETEYSRDEAPRRVWDDYSPPDYDYVNKFSNGTKTDGLDVWDHTSEDFVMADMGGYQEFYNDRVGGSSGNDYYSAAAMMVWSDSNMHNRNTFSENCRTSGKVDPVRIKKQAFYAMQAAQSREPKIHIVGHWSYPEYIEGDTENGNYWYNEKTFNGTYWEETGKKLQRDPTKKKVYVVGSPDVSKVELYVNDRKVGECSKPTNTFVYVIPDVDVTESGKVSAVAYNARGEKVAEDEIVTAGEPATLRLTPVTGPDGLIADGSDIAYFDVEVVDKDGNVCPLSYDKLNMSITGPAELLGGYNSGVGSKITTNNKDFCYAECGTNRIFIRSARNAGEITLSVALDGKTPVESKITSVDDLEMNGGLTLKAQRSFAQGEVPEVIAQEVEPLKLLGSTFTADFGEKGNTYLWDPTDDMDTYTMKLNGKTVEGYAQKPYRPDTATGVLCDVINTLKTLKEAGLDIEYTVQTEGELPEGYDGGLPMVSVTKGLKEGFTALDIPCGSTTLYINKGEDKNLLNAEITSAGDEVIAEISGVLGYFENVSYSRNENTKCGNIVVSGIGGDKALLEYADADESVRVTAIEPLENAYLLFVSYEDGLLKSVDIGVVNLAASGAYNDKTPSKNFVKTNNMKVMLWDSEMTNPLANAVSVVSEEEEEETETEAELSAVSEGAAADVWYRSAAELFADGDGIDMTYAEEIFKNDHNDDDASLTDGPDGTSYLKVTAADTKFMNLGGAATRKEVFISYDFRFDPGCNDGKDMITLTNAKDKTGPMFSLNGTTLRNATGGSSYETIAQNIEAGKWYTMELEGKFVVTGASVTCRVYGRTDGVKDAEPISVKENMSLRNFYGGSTGFGDFEFIKAKPGISIDNEYALALYADKVAVSSIGSLEKIKAGATLQFSASATRKGKEITAPEYEWSLYNADGTAVLEDEDIEISQSGLLQVGAEAKKQDITVRASAKTAGNPSGDYKIAIDAVDKSTDTYDELEISADKDSVRAGEPVRITAAAKKDGTEVTPGEGDLKYLIYNSADLRELGNENITITDDGVLSVTDKAVAQTITVRGTNISGSITKTCKVNVLPSGMNKDSSEDKYPDTYVASDACEEYIDGVDLHEGSPDGSAYYEVTKAYNVMGAAVTSNMIFSADMKFAKDGAGWNMTNKDGRVGFQLTTSGTKLNAIKDGSHNSGSMDIDKNAWYHVELMCITGVDDAYGVCLLSKYNEDGSLGEAKKIDVSPRNMAVYTADRVSFNVGTCVDNVNIFYVSPDKLELTLDSEEVLAGVTAQATVVASRKGVAFPRLDSSLIKYDILDKDELPLMNDKITIGMDGKVSIDATVDGMEIYVRVSAVSGGISDQKKLVIKSSDIFEIMRAGFDEDNVLRRIVVNKAFYYDDEVTFVVTVSDKDGNIKKIGTKKLYGSRIAQGESGIAMNFELPEDFDKENDVLSINAVTSLSFSKVTDGADTLVTESQGTGTKISGLPAFDSDTKIAVLALKSTANEKAVKDEDILYFGVIKTEEIADGALTLKTAVPSDAVVKISGKVGGVFTIAASAGSDNG